MLLHCLRETEDSYQVCRLPNKSKKQHYCKGNKGLRLPGNLFKLLSPIGSTLALCLEDRTKHLGKDFKNSLQTETSYCNSLPKSNLQF